VELRDRSDSETQGNDSNGSRVMIGRRVGFSGTVRDRQTECDREGPASKGRRRRLAVTEVARRLTGALA